MVGIVRRVREGEQFWDVGEEEEQVFLGSADDGLQQLVVDEEQGELELFDDDADLSDQVLLVFDEVVDELD